MLAGVSIVAIYFRKIQVNPVACTCNYFSNRKVQYNSRIYYISNKAKETGIRKGYHYGFAQKSNLIH